MANVLYKHVFSQKFLIRLTFVALGLSYGIPQAQSAQVKAPVNAGNQYNWLAGGGG